MANYFTRFLNGFVQGATNPKGNMGDWRHAQRLFVDNNFALSPRTKYMYHVNFELNTLAVKAPFFTREHQTEVGLLAKNIDLPKYSFEKVTKNQYNRKKIVVKNMNYDPVNLTFHDDNTGVINGLWAIYMGYYNRDRLNPEAAFNANHYRSAVTSLNNFRYGLDADISVPFIRKIHLYTLSRKRFNGYTLINPRIVNWQHGTMGSGETGTAESTMTVEYEAVIYTQGKIIRGSPTSPKGFALLHYDNTPSPLSVAGGGTSTLLGEGGVLDGLESIFGDLSSGSTFASGAGFLSTTIAAINTYKNIRNLSSETLKQEAINIISSPRGLDTVINTVGGVVGAVFPKNTTEGTTTAPSKSLVRNAAGGEQA